MKVGGLAIRELKFQLHAIKQDIRQVSMYPSHACMLLPILPSPVLTLVLPPFS